MKCPSCKSDKYDLIERLALMLCKNCRAVHSVTWSKGFWAGYSDAEANTVQPADSVGIYMPCPDCGTEQIEMIGCPELICPSKHR